MDVTERANALSPYLQQLLDNQDLQENLRQLAGNSRQAYGRARGRKARQAAADKQLQRRVLAAVQAAREVYLALGEAPARSRPRGRGRALVVVAALGAGAYLAADTGARAKVTALLRKSPSTSV